MRIGIDISQVVYEGTGVSRFTKGLINAILTYGTENKWVFFYSGFRRRLQKEIKDLIEKKDQTLIQYKIPPKILAGIWIKIGFTVESIDKSLDWFITSDWAEIPSKHTKKATIVHDMTYMKYPELVEKNIQNVQRDRLKRIKKESSIIISDSYSTKDDIIYYMGINEKKIVVNYPGVTVERPSKDQINDTLKKYHLDKPYILSVGKIEPRKNLPKLIEVFQSLHRSDIELIIVGPKGWESLNNFKFKISNLKLLGQVSDMELYCLYAGSLFFVYPSLWEGFGYPIIEAMQLGTAVTCSNTSSLKELGKENAIMFNPSNSEEMKSAIEKLLNNKSLLSDLANKGKIYAKTFTWKRYYNTMIESLNNHI